jgi:hypothetical protein
MAMFRIEVLEDFMDWNCFWEAGSCLLHDSV